MLSPGFFRRLLPFMLSLSLEAFKFDEYVWKKLLQKCRVSPLPHFRGQTQVYSRATHLMGKLELFKKAVLPYTFLHRCVGWQHSALCYQRGAKESHSVLSYIPSYALPTLNLARSVSSTQIIKPGNEISFEQIYSREISKELRSAPDLWILI